MRSLLLVDTTDDAALEAILGSEADAVCIDVPDDVAARPVLDLLRTASLSTRRPLIFAVLPPIEAGQADQLLETLMAGEPDGILLRRCRGGRDVQHLSVKLAVHEAVHGLADGETRIIAEAGASARALFGMETFIGASDRLMGLSWDPQGLAADLGTEAPALGPSSPLLFGRALTLVTARAAETCAIDGPGRFDVPARFRAECERARSDGFNAKLATSAAEIAIINAVFDRDNRVKECVTTG